MLQMKEAVRIADSLEKVFADVVLDGEKLAVRAKGHNIIPTWQGCKHQRTVVVTDITAHIKDSYLVSGNSPVRYERVRFCQRCDKVMEAVRWQA